MYWLALPEKYSWLHNVFLVQFIEEYQLRDNEPPLPIPDLEDDNEWEIEEVKYKRMIRDQVHYLVKWEGWPTKYNQWIPEDDIGNA